MNLFPLLEKLIQHFSSFPGIGRKTASRLAWHLVSEDKQLAYDFAECIRSTVDKFVYCSRCLMLSETDPCPICSNPQRDDSMLCLVESTSDIFLIENMNEYHGRYFVLGHLLSPLEGIGPDELHLKELDSILQTNPPKEIILALKPSAEGEATIHFLSEFLKDKPLELTRLSTGIPFGGDLEYTSTVTLANAWKRRHKV